MANQKKNSKQGLDAEEMLNRSETFIEANKKIIIGVIAAIIVVVVAVLLYKNYYQAPRQLRASEALFPGQNYFNAGDYEKALNGDSISYFGFAKVISDFKGTDAANLAKFYAGISLAKMGKYEEAVGYLESYKSSDTYVAANAMAALGNCKINLGDLDQGASLLVKAADKADLQSSSPVWLRQAGMVYEKLGRNDKALQCYNKIKQRYPNSRTIANDIDKYIEKVTP